jgi:glycosyltransferase involved in cell wall biosynthesis
MPSGLNALLVHQNFPAQFRHLAPALAAGNGNRIVVLHANPVRPLPGVETVSYAVARHTGSDIHPWVAGFEAKVIRGEAIYRAAKLLRSSGFRPDVIIAHPGWGETMFLRDIWPHVPQGHYCEFYYRAAGADVNFDLEFGFEEDAASRLRVKNAHLDMHMADMKAGLSPTLWQRSTYPEHIQPNISVIHDGIDTELIAPGQGTGFDLRRDGGLTEIRSGDEIITFVTRNLEPARGCHTFIRALPEILRRRPRATVLVVGGDDVSYGSRPSPDVYPPGKSWKDIFLDDVRSDLDMSRIHFLGRVPYKQYIAVLQVSMVHVYLTRPFVLSWSLLEAMSAGCAVVASDTAPVREVMKDGVTGRLVDFFDPGAVADAVCLLCDAPEVRHSLGNAARRHVLENFDLRAVCLPAQMAWVKTLAG